MKTAIVTGGNSGLGFYCAQKLAKEREWYVVIACRDRTKADLAVAKIQQTTATALGLSAADGLLPVSQATALGLLSFTAWQIVRNWDKLWAEAEKILVTQEPEPQVETPNNTSHGQSEQQTAEDYVLESNRRDLDSHDDAGGHTRERHVGKSDQWLRDRQRNDNIKDSSSFTDDAAANRTQGRFVKAYDKEIKEWLNNKKVKRPFSREIVMDREIGKVISEKGKVRPTKKAKLVLRKDNSELGYYILTSFPIP